MIGDASPWQTPARALRCPPEAVGGAADWCLACSALCTCRRSSPGFSLRTTPPHRIAISPSLLRRASISWTRPAGCTCARSCTAWRAPPATPRNTRKIGAASILCASSFEAPRTGLPALFSGDRHLFGTDSPGRLFLMGSDDYGRDQFSRFLHGGQISLFAGLLGAGLSLGVGMRARRAGRLLRSVGG